MLPDAFLAADGLFETTLTVLNQMEIFDAVIEQELLRYLPFLLTTTVMMEAVKKGTGRESAHEAIKEHAVATVRALRSGSITGNDLFSRLAADPRLSLSLQELDGIFTTHRNNTGDALTQVDSFCQKIDALAKLHPQAATYQPGVIL